MSSKLDRIRSSLPKVRVSPRFTKILGFFKRILSMVAITLGIICVLLSVSEAIVYAIDTSQGVKNYVDWTSSLIAPIVMALVFGAIAALLNIERFFKRKKGLATNQQGSKLEIPDLD